MPSLKYDPVIFCLVVLSWPIIIGLAGAFKALFSPPEDIPGEES